MARQKSKRNRNDFDLDNYLEEKGYEDENDQFQKDETEVEDRRYTNALIVIVAIAGMFWYFDWNPREIYQTYFGSAETELVADNPVVIEVPTIEVPEVVVPDVDIDLNIDPNPDIDVVEPQFDFNSNEQNLGPIVEYLQELNNLGLLDDKISAFSAREVYEAGVPINYLLELDQQGLLGELSYVAIDAFYNNQVPFDYLQQVRDRGYWEKLSYISVAEFYENGVSFDYLDIMDNAGYLDELSFVHISEYYKNDIPPEFLDQLKESGIYESLSFIDVVEIYKSQN